jgi:predicted Zn-dependent peptidase
MAAKQYSKGIYVLRTETHEGIARHAVMAVTEGLPLSYLQEFGDRVDRVPLADIDNAARRFMSRRDLTVVVAGDSRQIAGQVRCSFDSMA